MTSTEKQNNEYAFKQLNANYQKLTLDASKAYYLTLANSCEVHLIKKDATKSVFIGRFSHISTSEDMKTQLADMWTVLENYFLTPVVPVSKDSDSSDAVAIEVELEDFGSGVAPKTVATPTDTDVKSSKKKVSTKKAKVETVAEPVLTTEPATDDGLVIDPEEESAFDNWADKLGE